MLLVVVVVDRMFVVVRGLLVVVGCVMCCRYLCSLLVVGVVFILSVRCCYNVLVVVCWCCRLVLFVCGVGSLLVLFSLLVVV